MQDKEVYALTSLGETQLRGALTTTSTEEVDLLVRIDGVLTVGQIRSGYKPEPPENFDWLFTRLIDKGLVVRREDDPFADQFSFKPSKSAIKRAEAEADAGTASLQKAGYFVRIARQTGRQAPAEGQEQVALIVEDDEHLSKFLQHYMAFEGFGVRTASTRAEVIAQLRKEPVPDLVLLDVVLPDADGFAILMKMRQHPLLKDVPVIMLTAKATREAVLQGLAAGAQGYVTKPFEPEALIDAVRTVMGLPGDPDEPPPSDDPWPEKAR